MDRRRAKWEGFRARLDGLRARWRGRARARDVEGAYEPVDVAFVAESTYPYQRGGVASIIHGIILGMPEVSVGLVYVTWDRSCHGETAYPLPRNVKWVYHLYLSSAEVRQVAPGRRAAAAGPVQALPRGGAARRALAAEVFAALRGLQRADYDGLRAVFYRFFHLPTRTFDFWQLYRTREFLEVLQAECGDLRVTVTELFWLQREFFALGHALLHRWYPPARVYHAHIQLSGGLAAVVAAAQNDGRAVLTEHGLYVRDSINYLFKRCASHDVVVADDLAAVASDPRARAWMHWFLRLGDVVYEMADASTYQYTKHIEAAALYGSRPHKARLISNGLEFEQYAKARERQDQRHALRRLQFAREPGGAADPTFRWRLAYMGRIVFVKGIVELIRAAALLRGQVSWAFQLDIIGPATEEPQCLALCQALARELGVDDAVRFPGAQDLSEALGDVDVMILPSYSEALPIVILEAMAAGVPVIATDTGSVEEILARPVSDAGRGGGVPGPAGLVVPPRDAPAIAQALLRLLEDGAFYETCHRNGPLRVARAHLAADVVKAYRDLYEDLGVARAAPRDLGVTTASLPRKEAGRARPRFAPRAAQQATASP